MNLSKIDSKINSLLVKVRISQESIKESVRALSKKDESLISNLVAVESILASSHDYVVGLSQKKQEALKPLLNRLETIALEFDNLNESIKEQIQNQYGEKAYGNLIVGVINMLEIASGHNDYCNGCEKRTKARNAIKRGILNA